MMNLPNLGPTIKRENIVVTMRAFLNPQTHNRAWLTVTQWLHQEAIPTGRLIFCMARLTPNSRLAAPQTCKGH